MRFAAFVLVAAFAVPAWAQTSFPMITHVSPVAVQRGTAVEVSVDGQMNFHGAHKVLIEGSGISAEIVKPKESKEPKDAKPADPKAPMPTVRSIKVKFTATADALLGVREFRIATELGLSSLGQLVVVDDPVVSEQPGNGTLAKAQPVPLPSVVCGRIEVAENVDYYKFPAKAGQTVTFEVYCARIQDKIHDLQKHADPLIRVFDSSGKELAAADDEFFADPVLAVKIPADGEYVVEIRDTKYDGDPRWVYALAITNKPYSLVPYPLAANPSQTISVEPSGSAKQASPTFSLNVPSQPGIHLVQLGTGSNRTNPVPVVVTPLPLVNETEPNDTVKQATRISIPGGANGRIQAKRDLDHFAFKGEKGKAVRLEVFARRFGTPLRSRLDANLDVMAADGRVLATNDDVNGKDPMLLFTPPADGDYFVRIRDLNNKGGEGFVYYLEADFARPDFTLKVDPSKAMIGPGSRTAWYAIVNRVNGFEGPVTVEVKGLPKGMTVNPLTIPANMTQGCLVVSAAADAKPDAGIIEIVGTAETKDSNGKPVKLVHSATAVEEIYMPGGGRGRFDAGMQAAAITGPSDILEVKVSTTEVVLKPGQEVTINVTLKRRGDYDKTVTLDVPLRHLGSVFATPASPGVSMVDGKSKTLLGTGNTGTIVLKAEANAAETGPVPICVQAFVPVNFVVKIGYASEVIRVSVKK